MQKFLKQIKKDLDIHFFAGLAVVALAIAIFAFQSWAPAIYLKGRVFSYFSHRPKILGNSIVRLPAVFHRQEHSLSCEAAALKMALSGVGITVPEGELINRLAFDQTPRRGGVWGDPNLGFVGDIDGRMGVTGYGVYWQPIKDVALNYTYAEVLENASPKQLAEQILAGRPIVWWGYFGRGRKLYWQTPEGNNIEAVNGEHARTIIGFTGDPNDPTGFILLDPIYGELYWDTQELLKNSEVFGNHGVVIYSHESLFGL